MKNAVGIHLKLIIFCMTFFNFLGAKGQSVVHSPNNNSIFYTGRIDFSNPEKPRLVGAGSYFELKFKGTSCSVLFENTGDQYNYIAIVLDGEYKGRVRTTQKQQKYEVATNLKDTEHTLLICKATEALIGPLDFKGIQCDEILPFNKTFVRKIEFIGNSITSGTGLDLSGVPCGKGVWHDQHNAYLAYGPVTARALNANWLLSSVSGMGMLRNWNNEGPALPQMYDHLYLDANSKMVWEPKFYVPDLISICLGTNDFSDGDGSYDRKKLDSTKFVNAYIAFVKHLRERYPKAPICLLTSPSIAPENNIKFSAYLSAVIHYMKETEQDNNFYKFEFKHNYSGGCDGHPNAEEHQKMSDELVPFYKKVMNW
jgi:lysophospholipase L1-like esterase